MQRWIGKVATRLMLGACAAPKTQAAHTRSPSMTGEVTRTNTQTIRRLYEQCINGNQPELFPELVADDYIGPQNERGPSGFASTIARVRAGIPDIHFTIEELVSEGDRVAVRWIWKGHHTGTFFGMSPTDKAIENAGIAIYALRNGRIVSSSLQTDRLGILQQIGVLPKDLSAARVPTEAPRAE